MADYTLPPSNGIEFDFAPYQPITPNHIHLASLDLLYTWIGAELIQLRPDISEQVNRAISNLTLSEINSYRKTNPKVVISELIEHTSNP